MPDRRKPVSGRRVKRRPDKTPKPVIGWREWARLPQLGVKDIRIKVDTGARTSALHAFNVRPYSKNGQDRVRFEVHPLQRNDELVQSCDCPASDYRWVTNSGGGREKRFVIVTPILLGEEEWPIEITLTGRDEMGFRMLLGRSAMQGRFVVDPERSHCLGRKRPRRAVKDRPRTRTTTRTHREEE